MSDATAENRKQLVAELFPEGIPKLWCPPLTHYAAAGAVDHARMSAHLRHLAPWVKGYLIPGTTGDGWELSESETREVLGLAVGLAQTLDLHLLVGALTPGAATTRARVLEMIGWLRELTGAEDAGEIMAKARVCGFAVCPRTGADLSQEVIHRGLASILELGLPTALYQLPQVTRNEMSPEIAAALADRFPNLFLLKDSSGADRVALSGRLSGDVFLVRGAEGDYARWLGENGGPYDGLLLSTANCFPRELHSLIASSAAGNRAGADAISGRLTSLMDAVFALVDDLPDGNRYANANKAIDHFMAHGPGAAELPPPRLHPPAGGLPLNVIRGVGEELARHGLMPERGYLE